MVVVAGKTTTEPDAAGRFALMLLNCNEVAPLTSQLSVTLSAVSDTLVALDEKAEIVGTDGPRFEGVGLLPGRLLLLPPPHDATNATTTKSKKAEITLLMNISR